MCSRSSIAARVARRVLVRLLPVVGLALVGAAGCSTETSDDDELRALLHDEPVTQIAHSALSSETGAGGATGTGTGTGGGGTPVGIAGNSGDAGAVMTGTGGGMTAPDAGVVGGSRGTVDGGLMGVAGFTGAAGSGPAGRGGPVAGSTGTGNTMGIAGVTGRGGSGPGGRGGSGPFPGSSLLGQWNFDDCSSFRTNLSDTSGQNNMAFRAVNTACGEGIAGMAVALNNKDEDLVYVPDQPTFTFNTGVTVAGWFAHTSINQTRTLFRKREAGSNSSFALVLNNSKYQFVVDLGSTLVSVTAPTKATANEWTHVGATYDGNTLRLYVGGVEVANKAAIGTILGGSGPLLMGNDGSKRLMAGRMDQAAFATRALTASEMGALTCLRRAPSIAGTPAVSAPTPAGTPAVFDIALTNNDTASCSAADFVFQVQTFNQGINVQPSSALLSVPAGTTGHLAMTATASDDVDSGTFPIQFFTVRLNNQIQQQSASGRVDFVVVQSGCRVSTPRELMITNLGVVDNVRAFGDGVWSFKHLMEAMAPTPEDAPAMVEQMLTSFTTNQTVNGFDLGPRPGMQSQIDLWPRTPDGKLDLGSPLVQLNAIVNRFDLRNLAAGDAGEGRFVFSFLFPSSPFPRQATIILEYKLPATTPEDVMAWANAWHGLGSLTPGSEEYNAALEVITERFAGRGMRPGRPNGNAVNAVRTNEIDFGFNGLWELREFVLSAETGMLVPATIKLTPDLSFNFGDKLGRFVNANEASILTETHDVPETFEGEHFLGGAVFNDLGTPWFAFNITNNEARHKFALNTCNGCHSFEAGVSFLQILPRFPGGEAGLSGFLTGTTVSDPVTGQPRTFNDLGRRRADLKALVCPTEPQPVTIPGGMGPRPAPSPSSNIKLGTLAKGLSRVH
jgi:Concanavalin A-like lectin/glucanases superfamily